MRSARQPPSRNASFSRAVSAVDVMAAYRVSILMSIFARGSACRSDAVTPFAQPPQVMFAIRKRCITPSS